MFTKRLLSVTHCDHAGDTTVSIAVHPCTTVYKWDAVCKVTESAVREIRGQWEGAPDPGWGAGAGASWEKEKEELLR